MNSLLGGKTVLFLYIDEQVTQDVRDLYDKAIVAHENRLRDGDRFRDSGFDLCNPNTIHLDRMDYDASHKKPITLNHLVKAACYFVPDGTMEGGVNHSTQDESWIPLPYYLYPRSSISKTPLRMANSVGIIDAGYRGFIMGKADWMNDGKEVYDVEKGIRLFQLCAYNLLPFDRIHIVETEEGLGEKTIRGTGGFGSTNEE